MPPKSRAKPATNSPVKKQAASKKQVTSKKTDTIEVSSGSDEPPPKPTPNSTGKGRRTVGKKVKSPELVPVSENEQSGDGDTASVAEASPPPVTPQTPKRSRAKHAVDLHSDPPTPSPSKMTSSQNMKTASVKKVPVSKPAKRRISQVSPAKEAEDNVKVKKQSHTSRKPIKKPKIERTPTPSDDEDSVGAIDDHAAEEGNGDDAEEEEQDEEELDEDEQDEQEQQDVDEDEDEDGQEDEEEEDDGEGERKAQKGIQGDSESEEEVSEEEDDEYVPVKSTRSRRLQPEVVIETRPKRSASVKSTNVPLEEDEDDVLAMPVTPRKKPVAKAKIDIGKPARKLRFDASEDDRSNDGNRGEAEKPRAAASLKKKATSKKGKGKVQTPSDMVKAPVEKQDQELSSDEELGSAFGDNKVKPKDNGYSGSFDLMMDTGTLDPCLEKKSQQLRKTLVAIFPKTFRDWKGSSTLNSGVQYSSVLREGAFYNTKRACHDLLWRGYGTAVNLSLADPKTLGVLSCDNRPTVAIKDGNGVLRMATAVSPAILRSSNIPHGTPFMSKMTRKRQVANLSFPGMFFERMQGAIHMVFGYKETNLRCQMDSDSVEVGTMLEPDTRSAFTNTPKIYNASSSPIKKARRTVPAVESSGPAMSDESPSLPYDAEIPVYDARNKELDYQSECPAHACRLWSGGPPSDVPVLAGFTVHTYPNTRSITEPSGVVNQMKADWVSFNIKWLAILDADPVYTARENSL
ncbi:hypothetical protein DFH11DRAFT_1732286 [Phellopilus nigrolimitatus]|nr:hypothetical protein DFH11DRAFT_1732286 [Phellopilus nigrolimitatus]